MSLTTSEREELERLRSQTETQRAERLVRAAAKDWHDADDAVALLRSNGDLKYIETAAEAASAVKLLAMQKPHHLRVGTDLASTPTPVATSRDGLPILTGEQLYALTKPQLDELKERDPGLYARSLENWF